MNARISIVVAAITLALAGASPFSASAATHTWTGAGGGLWSSSGNWSGGAPAAGEAPPVVLVFPAAGLKSTTNDIPNLTVDQIQVSGDNYWIVGSGAGTNVTLRSQVLGQTFFLSGANAIITNFLFNLSTNVVASGSLNISSGDTATFRSRFTGNGGLIKYGSGTVRLQGGAPNTYLGDTAVYGGDLELSHNSNAIPGNLIVGNPSLTTTGTVSLLFQHQVADTASVTVHANGVFDPFVYSETVSFLTISNVSQVGGPGLTVLNSLISYGQSSLSGILQLAGAQRTIYVGGGHLTITGFIENNTGIAGITKTGGGSLQLNQDNGYNGSTLINNGILYVANAGALGTSAFQTQVNPGGTLDLESGINLVSEPLTLYGDGFNGLGALRLHSGSTWNGDIQLQTNSTVTVIETNAAAILNSTISSSGGLIKDGPGTLRLAGTSPNTFAGETTVLEGVLQLAKPASINAIAGSLHIGQNLDGPPALAQVVLLNAHQIADVGSLYVDASGGLDLNGLAERVGPLSLRRGTVTTGAGTLTLGANVHVFVPGGFFPIPFESRITGQLSLGGVDRVFDCDMNGHLKITGSIIDGGAPAGITKLGIYGDLRLYNGPNSYSGVTDIQSGSFGLCDGATPGSPAGGTIIGPHGYVALVNTTVGNESLSLNSLTDYAFGGLFFAYTNTWAGPITVNANSVLYSYYDTDRLTLSGPIVGPGSFTKRYVGTLALAGSDDNVLAGPLVIDEGVLELNKSAGAAAVSGPLILGNDTNAANTAVARLKAPNQIANSAPVTINASGLLDIGIYNDTVGPLTLRGGAANGASGLLTFGGNITGQRSGAISSIGCRSSLGGFSRTFLVESNAYIILSNDLLDGGGSAGFTKAGVGALYIMAPTSYGGPTLVNEGWMLLAYGGTPGSSASGTTVGANGSLHLANTIVPAESLTLNGNTNFLSLVSDVYVGTPSNYWGGPVTLNGPVSIYVNSGVDFALGGPISGSGSLSKEYYGTLHFTGGQANSYAGKTTVRSGSLVLAKTAPPALPGALEVNYASSVSLKQAEQIDDLAPVWLGSYATLDLNGLAETIGSLAGEAFYYYEGGVVTHVTNAFRVGLNNQSTVFDGVISGSGGTNLVKVGSGELKLLADHPYAGKTLVHGGTLFLTGSVSNSAVTVYANATLAGNATVASLTSIGGTLSPAGFGAQSRYGRLRSLGSINLGSSSKFIVDLGGTNAGVDLDQLEMVGGSLTIPGCSLVLTQNLAGSISNQYPILNTVAGGASMGTFTGLAEGANVVSSSGRSFRINYFAGTGNNDVVLNQLDATSPANFTGIPNSPAGIQLSGLGAPNAQYLVQANTNLATTNWLDLEVIVASGNGSLQFLDSSATNYPMRFYRFLAQ